MEAKHAHHYVWRHYLESWEVDGRVSCLRDNRIKRINAVNLAVENDFYRLPTLNTAEIQFVNRAAELMPSRGHKAAKNFIAAFVLPSHVRAALGDAINSNTDLYTALTTYEANTEENWHTAIERTAIPILKELKDGDVSFYLDKDRCSNFMYFMSLQLLRTKKLRKKPEVWDGDAHGIDFVKTARVTVHFGAANLGCNLYMRRNDDPITLLINETSVGFLTSDQPVINFYAGTPRALKELAIYYPVSPTRAILFGDLDVGRIKIPQWNVEINDVQKLNRLMAQQSHKMVFARHEDDFY